jgi:hypothetical protein
VYENRIRVARAYKSANCVDQARLEYQLHAAIDVRHGSRRRLSDVILISVGEVPEVPVLRRPNMLSRSSGMHSVSVPGSFPP